VIESVKDMYSALTLVLTEPFAAHGFALRKRCLFEKASGNGRTRRYSMRLSKRNGWFSLHLTLQLLDPALMKRVNAVLEKALRDERFQYPDNWSQALIEKTIAGRTSNQVVAELTDWRTLKDASETLDSFNERFSIWLFSFDSPDEKAGWKEQLLASIGLALKWFGQVDSDDWILANTVYPSLYLQSIEGPHGLQGELRWDAPGFLDDPEEVKLFCQHLL